MEIEKILKDMVSAGILARDHILKVYSKAFDVEIKEDNSPVTEADIGADKIIREYLSTRYPEFGFLTEESKDDKSRLTKDYIFIVDPVDGTKDFVARNDEFTTNIALCYKHEIIAGVVLIPAMNQYYYAIKGKGAFFVDENGNSKQIHVNNKLENLTVLCSRFHTKPEEQAIFDKYPSRIANIETKGSSLKACKIASGEAELSYRISPGTKEWDTAAFDIIVTEAGGLVLKPDKTPMKYNREEVRNLEGYVIMNRIENMLL